MDFKKYDAIIVGAGISGTVLARELADNGKRVLIVEKRGHIGGNMYDYVNEQGVLVHKYGPHIFHTSDKKVYEYVSRYSDWCDYNLTYASMIDGKLIQMPFCLDTIDILFEEEYAEYLKLKILDSYKNEKKISVFSLISNEDADISSFGKYLYDNEYRPYTEKQWGIKIKCLNKSVIDRVPFYLCHMSSYFQDDFQCLPKESYSSFFSKMLNHKNVDVRLNCNAFEMIKIDKEKRIVMLENEIFDGYLFFTGMLDELFGYELGRLPYRSLEFVWKSTSYSCQDYAVIAYPNSEKYTRIVDYSKLTVQTNHSKASVSLEIPCDYCEGTNTEPYYPILTEKSKELYSKYLDFARGISKLVLCGRLANYKYINMDEAIRNAINIAQESIRKMEE